MSRRFYLVLVAALGALLSCPGFAGAAPCIGDCDLDGRVLVSELVTGINLALGLQSVSLCTAFDSDLDGAVTVDELLQSVSLALGGCPINSTPTVQPSASPSPSPSPTASLSPSPSPTPTSVPNRGPVVHNRSFYLAFPGEEIAIELTATDPEGGATSCTTVDLPDGASFEAESQVLRWSPTSEQVGRSAVSFACVDEATPPATTSARFEIEVRQLHPCVAARCTADQCSEALTTVSADCCPSLPLPRATPAPAICPEGARLEVGRNFSAGFGRLHSCDQLRLLNFGQTSVAASLNLAVWCLDATDRIDVHVRLETRDRLAIDSGLSRGALFEPRADGGAEILGLRFPVDPPRPFFDLEGVEANLVVTATDRHGTRATASLRVRTTFEPLPDLPDDR